MFDLRVILLVIVVIVLLALLAYAAARYKEQVNIPTVEETSINAISNLLSESKEMLGKMSGFQRTFFGVFGGSLLLVNVLIIMPATYQITQATFVNGFSSWLVIHLIFFVGFLCFVASILNTGFIGKVPLIATMAFMVVVIVGGMYLRPTMGFDGTVNENVVGYEASTDFLLYTLIGTIQVFSLNVTYALVYVVFPVCLILGVAALIYYSQFYKGRVEGSILDVA